MKDGKQTKLSNFVQLFPTKKETFHIPDLFNSSFQLHISRRFRHQLEYSVIAITVATRKSFSSMNKEINFGPSEDGSVDQSLDSKFYNNGALKNEYINGIHNGVTQWNSSNFG